MTLSRDLSLVLGAVLGIAAVYIAPSTPSLFSDEKSRPKKCKDNQNPKIVVQDPDNNIVHADVHPINDPIKYYGESTVLDLLNNLKTEVLNLLDCTGVRMFIPDASESTNTPTIYEDAESEFAKNGPQIAARETPNESIHSAPDTTIYNTLPNQNINGSSSQKKGVTTKIRKIYSGLTSKSGIHNPKAESTTVIDSNRSENDKSGFILSIKNPISPVRRAFRRVMNLLRVKNNSSQNTDYTPKPDPWCATVHKGDCNNNDITLYF